LLAKGLVFARRNSASKCILYWIFTENNALRLLTNIRKYQRFGYYDATSLRDLKARTRIAARIKNAEIGNFGDYKPVGEGVYEIRIDVGAGYRVYFYQQADVIYLLLLGGDKKTQKRDIVEAKKMKKQLVLEGK